jgi:plastocyanin
MMLPHRLAIVVPLAVLALTGCGSTKDTASTTPATAPSTVAATTTASAAPAGKAKTVKVAIKDFDYAPRRLVVANGTRVTWTNADPANHTVTFDTGAKRSLGNQPKGKSVSFTFTRSGTFAYHCDYHPNMHGMVVVR